MPMKISEAIKPKPSAAVAGVCKFLDQQKPDTVFKTAELLALVKVGRSLLTRARAETVGYSHLIGKDLFWGSKKAISALRKALEG